MEGCWWRCRAALTEETTFEWNIKSEVNTQYTGGKSLGMEKKKKENPEL